MLKLTTKLHFAKQMIDYFVLEEIEPELTKVDIEVFAEFIPFGIIYKNVFKEKPKKDILENSNHLICLINPRITLKSNTEN